MKNRLGYCCINMTLSEVKPKDKRITTNRAMVKKTFDERGITYASELSLANVKDLKKVIEWNNAQSIGMYRMSSDVFPWSSEYELSELPDFQEIKTILNEIGAIAIAGGQRLTFHPSPYSVLASLRPDVVQKALKELHQHAEIMDLMGLPRTLFYPINIHVNTTQPTKEEAAARFCENFHLLSDSVKSRLVVEVDDKPSQFTSVDLKTMVHDVIGIPITFDYLHNDCNPPADLSQEDSLKICLGTWPIGMEPITHYSGSKRLHEDASAKVVAHSDWMYEKIPTYGLDFAIELEVKMKERALLKYLIDFEGN